MSKVKLFFKSDIGKNKKGSIKEFSKNEARILCGQGALIADASHEKDAKKEQEAADKLKKEADEAAKVAKEQEDAEKAAKEAAELANKEVKVEKVEEKEVKSKGKSKN